MFWCFGSLNRSVRNYSPPILSRGARVQLIKLTSSACSFWLGLCRLVSGMDNIIVVDRFYDKSNWCIILEKTCWHNWVRRAWIFCGGNWYILMLMPSPASYVVELNICFDYEFENHSFPSMTGQGYDWGWVFTFRPKYFVNCHRQYRLLYCNGRKCQDGVKQLITMVCNSLYHDVLICSISAILILCSFVMQRSFIANYIS